MNAARLQENQTDEIVQWCTRANQAPTAKEALQIADGSFLRLDYDECSPEAQKAMVDALDFMLDKAQHNPGYVSST